MNTTLLLIEQKEFKVNMNTTLLRSFFVVIVKYFFCKT